MAFHVVPLEPEDRPNLRNHHAVYGVFEDEKVVAYCLKNVDAAYVQAALAYVEKNMADFAKQFAEAEEAEKHL